MSDCNFIDVLLLFLYLMLDYWRWWLDVWFESLNLPKPNPVTNYGVSYGLDLTILEHNSKSLCSDVFSISDWSSSTSRMLKFLNYFSYWSKLVRFKFYFSTTLLNILESIPLNVSYWLPKPLLSLLLFESMPSVILLILSTAS